MKSTISGWSAFRITIFAARRVLPPLLITPANASKPFMKLTGPDAIPPPESVSLLPRSEEKLVPVPEPHLKSMPSVFAKSMIEPMSSRTELIKHAEHCGFGCTPTLNHTGELNAIFCSTSRCVSSSRNASRDAASAKYPPASPQRTMLFATRLMSCRTDPSRPGVPGFPLKYLLVTMLVAVCDQLLGTSTSSWRKIVTPFSLAISAVRFSHSTSSNGDTFPLAKYRSNTNPFWTPAEVFSAAAPASSDLPFNAGFTVAIRSSAPSGPLPSAGNPSILLLCVPQSCCVTSKRHRSSMQAILECRHLKRHRGKRQCSAGGRWVGLSLTAVTAPHVRARSQYFALGFFV